MIIGQRRPDEGDAGGGGVVLVDTLERHGLRCPRCGGNTRSEVAVHDAGGAEPIAELEGCTACRTGLYRTV